ncbi:hypothetical protein XpiCFBP4643_20270 [Xanthomonas pisi]|uniref:Uncharacterized protein n=1 Tax=Xanthomonas pisi TaxID=56457 RepID=A0A2S7CVF0_9XANT|nr:hypothetical protein XpiCFBP4643_20270 [Xanthomonas pisi]
MRAISDLPDRIENAADAGRDRACNASTLNRWLAAHIVTQPFAGMGVSCLAALRHQHDADDVAASHIAAQ